MSYKENHALGLANNSAYMYLTLEWQNRSHKIKRFDVKLLQSFIYTHAMRSTYTRILSATIPPPRHFYIHNIYYLYACECL